jgi:small subunit ribosomal protein S17
MAETKEKPKRAKAPKAPKAEKAPRPAPSSEELKARAMLRTIVGVVSSDKGNKSITVVVDFQTKHPKYGKYLRRRTTIHAHDEKNEAKQGDKVELAECRPLSKTKHHRLIRIVEKAPEQAVQVSAEEVMTGKAPEKR